jgi:hypothetical protein
VTVYVDPLLDHTGSKAPVVQRFGPLWCHLIADTSEELHAFAARLGMRRHWAQHEGQPTEHYDLMPGERALAVALGAREISLGDMGRMMRLKRERAAGKEMGTL